MSGVSGEAVGLGQGGGMQLSSCPLQGQGGLERGQSLSGVLSGHGGRMELEGWQCHPGNILCSPVGSLMSLSSQGGQQPR